MLQQISLALYFRSGLCFVGRVVYHPSRTWSYCTLCKRKETALLASFHNCMNSSDVQNIFFSVLNLCYVFPLWGFCVVCLLKYWFNKLKGISVIGIYSIVKYSIDFQLYIFLILPLWKIFTLRTFNIIPCCKHYWFQLVW